MYLKNKIVYVGGVFDLFHIGHLRLLKRARKFGDILVVGVLTDEAVMRWKRRPIIPYEQRVEIVKEFADIVVPQDDVDETETVKKINPDIDVKGDDSEPKGKKWWLENGKEIIYLPYTRNVSTTEIIEKIKHD